MSDEVHKTAINIICLFLSLIILGFATQASGQDNHLSVQQRLYDPSKPTYSSTKHLPIQLIDSLEYYQDMRHRKVSLKAATNIRPVGFFRTEKRSGRWWLINPYGHQHLSIGVNSVRIASKKAILEGLKDGPVRPLQQPVNSDTTWENSISKLWELAGFNSFGPWSELSRLSPLIAANRDYHYTINLNLLGGYLKSTDDREAYLPVFDPDFSLYAQNYMHSFSARAHDPALLGYFTDNEIPFWRVNLDDYLAIEDKNNTNYQAALTWLSEHALDRNNLGTSDYSQFRLHLLRKYLKIVTTAIKQVDSNHMILGPRLYGAEINDEEFLRTLGSYIDILSINFYHKLRPEKQQMHHWEQWSGKPFLISEFNIKATDSHKANHSGSGWLVDTQTDRGHFYQHFTLALLESRNCIGFHWYRYQDVSGQKGANKGLVNEKFEPYEKLLENMSIINRQVYFLVDYFDNQPGS